MIDKLLGNIDAEQVKRLRTVAKALLKAVKQKDKREKSDVLDTMEQLYACSVIRPDKEPRQRVAQLIVPARNVEEARTRYYTYTHKEGYELRTIRPLYEALQKIMDDFVVTVSVIADPSLVLMGWIERMQSAEKRVEVESTKPAENDVLQTYRLFGGREILAVSFFDSFAQILDQHENSPIPIQVSEDIRLALSEFLKTILTQFPSQRYSPRVREGLIDYIENTLIKGLRDQSDWAEDPLWSLLRLQKSFFNIIHMRWFLREAMQAKSERKAEDALQKCSEYLLQWAGYRIRDSHESSHVTESTSSQELPEDVPSHRSSDLFTAAHCFQALVEMLEENYQPQNPLTVPAASREAIASLFNTVLDHFESDAFEKDLRASLIKDIQRTIIICLEEREAWTDDPAWTCLSDPRGLQELTVISDALRSLVTERDDHKAGVLMQSISDALLRWAYSRRDDKA